MDARLSGKREKQVFEFGETRGFRTGGLDWQITLWPAGHVLGSAMALVEAQGESLLYTGDFKLKPGLGGETCRPQPADTLIVETTFGLPEYRFPQAEDVMEQIRGFVRETLERGETPRLLAYSLGKSQVVLSGLAELGIPIVLQKQTFRMTQIYEVFGVHFPPYQCWDGQSVPLGTVIITPPSARSVSGDGEVVVRSAMVTGWALDPGARYRYRVDAAFPLSDHADHPELLAFVRAVSPRRVFTVHGYAEQFADELCSLGITARPLQEPSQLRLDLVFPPASGPSPVAT